jgi:hypothetical protein
MQELEWLVKGKAGEKAGGERPVVGNAEDKGGFG